MTDFKLGRLPGVIPVGLRDLTFYSAGPLPKAPPTVPVPCVTEQPDGTPWGMLGNDQYGDCGVAGLEHGFMADAAITGITETPATTEQATSYYLTYDNNQDNGVVLSAYLGYVRQKGYYGRTVSAYAPVGVHDIPTMQFCIDAYGFAYTGINVTQAMMDAVQSSSSGWSWTSQDAAGEPIGGHCIPVVGYDDASLYAVTWGQVIAISYPAWHAISSEAWAVLTGELLAKGGDNRGVNLAALQSDLNRLANLGESMSLAAVEVKIKDLWEDLTGEAKADIEQALDDAKAEEQEVVQQVKAAITEAKLDAEAVIAAAEPELATSVRNLVAGLESKVIAILENLAK